MHEFIGVELYKSTFWEDFSVDKRERNENFVPVFSIFTSVI